MKKTLLILIVFALITTSIAFPFRADEGTRKFISDTLNILSSLSSFLTLIIALLLYNKFGIEHTLLERQTKAVFELLEALRKFSLHIHDDRTHIFFRVSRRNSEFLRRFKHRVLLFNSSTFKTIGELNDAFEDVFMPKSILEKLAPLSIASSISITEERQASKEYLRVSSPTFDEKDHKENYGLLNNEEMTLEQYIAHWNELIDSVQDWLQKNSSLKVDLNL